MIDVCVVDDQTLVRQGIRGLLELAPDIRVVAEAGSGDEALAVLVEQLPNVLVLDLRMPGLDGIGTLAAMAERHLMVPTLVLTTFDDEDLVLRALRTGARGYLLKDVTLEQLVHGIRTLAAGETLVQPAVTDRLLRALGGLPAQDADEDGRGGLPKPDRPMERLTTRELEILRLLAAGYSNREIASALHLAEGTVKNHVSNLLLKLDVRDRTRAVLRALHLGLLGSTDAEPTPGSGPRGGSPGGDSRL